MMPGARRGTAVMAGLVMLLTSGCARRGVEQPIAVFDHPGQFASLWVESQFGYAGDGERVWGQLEMPPTGVTALVINEQPFNPPFDLSGRFIRLTIEVDDVRRLQGMGFRLYSNGSESDYFEFSVPLFAAEPFNLLQSGVWQTITLSFSAAQVVGNPDRSAIDALGWIVVTQTDADAPDPWIARWGGLESVEQPVEGIVTITFDDGYPRHVDVAAPIMAQHDFPGVAYIMPQEVGAKHHLSLEQLHALHDEFGWDIAGHHSVSLTEVPEPERDRILEDVARFLTDNGFDRGSLHFAYPLGRQNPDVVTAVERLFDTARLGGGGPETLPPGDPYRLRPINVVSSTPVSDIRDAVRRAREHGDWVILMFHDLVETPARSTDYGIRAFEQAMDAIAEEGVAVRTMTDVWRRRW